ncbi:TonB-dependent receptor [Candidatus Parabeggiatoa sp. HSG14]|uniref:TonB-dependent receptor domain-containing protein n=1 Tax=Candidatus Parabeggiatoa sp. HSG14 TaxID=3055593 RepID=UPI0025A81875|nr:TonB-dependent receptor [Thiotrichales bacterium HSG14]
MKKYLLSLFLFFIFCPFSNAADNRLPNVVVTATRTAQTVNESLASVTVITRKDIERSQAFTLPDILRTVPGLDISVSGGLGKNASVYMRGTESSHVLVLLDGVKMGSATVGRVAFQHLPLSHVERIEVVRGPRSSLYGSEAIGGVIQIFTRKGKKGGHTDASVGAGEDNTYQFTAGVSGATKANWFSLQTDLLRTDGFNHCQGSTSGGCFTIEPDDDGYDNTSLSIRYGQRIARDLSIEGHAMRAKSHSQYDSSLSNEEDSIQQVFGLKTDYVLSDRWLVNLSAGRSYDETNNSGNNMSETFFNTERTVGSFVNNFFLAKNKTFTLGYDYQKDDVESSTVYVKESTPINSIDNQGLFVEYQTQLGNTQWIVGLRKDDNEQFSKHTTGNVAFGYALSPSTRFVTSYGTAFKAPAFNELYFPNYGNPNLDPEESESIEVGLTGKQSFYHWAINAYRTKIDKLIATNFDKTTNTYFADNLNAAKIKGMDISLNWHRGGWEFNSNVSWLKPKDNTTGNLLPRRAKTTVNVELAEKRGPARLSLNFLAQSHRYDDAANTQRLGGYGILNANFEQNLNKHWKFRIHLENLLDKEYYTAAFYNTQKRFWFVSLHYQY